MLQRGPPGCCRCRCRRPAARHTASRWRWGGSHAADARESGVSALSLACEEAVESLKNQHDQFGAGPQRSPIFQLKLSRLVNNTSGTVWGYSVAHRHSTRLVTPSAATASRRNSVTADLAAPGSDLASQTAAPGSAAAWLRLASQRSGTSTVTGCCGKTPATRARYTFFSSPPCAGTQHSEVALQEHREWIRPDVSCPQHLHTVAPAPQYCGAYSDDGRREAPVQRPPHRAAAATRCSKGGALTS